MWPILEMRLDIADSQRQQGKPPLTPDQMDEAVANKLRESKAKWKSIPPKSVDPQRQEDAFKNCRSYTHIGNNFTCHD